MGSTLILWTHQKSLIMGQEVCHVKAQEVFRGVPMGSGTAVLSVRDKAEATESLSLPRLFF